MNPENNQNVTRVFETYDWGTTNNLLEEGWILLQTGVKVSLSYDQPEMTVYYSLGWTGSPEDVEEVLSKHAPFIPEISDWHGEEPERTEEPRRSE